MRVTYQVEERREVFVGHIFVGGGRIYMAYYTSHQAAESWCQAMAAHLERELARAQERAADDSTWPAAPPST